MRPVTYSDGEIFERNGRSFRVNIERDNDSGTPWDREDGHGPVSEWMSRDKRPGERVLCEDHGLRRFYFYDFAEAVRIAHRDGWGISEKRIAEITKMQGLAPTARQIAALAAHEDYERLRRWCADLWEYVGVIVTEVTGADDPDSVETDYAHALWGIESDCEEYIAEVAHELADEIPAPDPATKPRTYTLAEIRNGTGWPKGARFALITDGDIPAGALAEARAYDKRLNDEERAPDGDDYNELFRIIGGVE